VVRLAARECGLEPLDLDRSLDRSGEDAYEPSMVETRERVGISQAIRGLPMIVTDRGWEALDREGVEEGDFPFVMVVRNEGETNSLLYWKAPATSAAANVVQRLTSRVSEAVDFLEQAFYPSASVGIALFPYDGDTPEALLRVADFNMYAAKHVSKRGSRSNEESLSNPT
jgi:hypothetical protein